jgi:hypothetical protein
MTHYLNVSVYSADSTLYHGDQVLVPVAIWRAFDDEHEGNGPMFVEVGDGAVGRLRPATAAEELGAEECRIPEWMWLRVGAPIPGEGWVSLRPVTLPIVAEITLRARHEADMLAMEDPVTVLSEQISAIRACVMVHSELVLPCGIFDIMELHDADGADIDAGCVLDTDVNLDIVPALDHKPRQPTPIPSPPFFSTRGADFSATTPTPRNTPILGSFTSFSGTGYILGNK